VNNLLIINSLQGSGGHRLGRIFSCYEKVYWYSHPNNGTHPWTFAENSHIKEAGFSRFHYDRLLPDGSCIPLIGSRIRKYWDSEEWFNNWKILVSNLLLTSQFYTIVVHDSPKYLRQMFKDSYIISLLSDPTESAKRHMSTSANFRIDFKMTNQRPKYESDWVKKANLLLASNPSATEKDLWEQYNSGNYYDYVLQKTKESNELNKTEALYSNATVSWDTIDFNLLTDHFGKLDDNYKKLLP